MKRSKVDPNALRISLRTLQKQDKESVEFLSEQAADNSVGYLVRAMRAVDETYGSGFSKKNPILVAAVIQAEAAEFHARFLGQILHSIDNSIDSVAANLPVKPLEMT